MVLFVFLSEILLDGGASYLTRRRGKVWVKELDYLYLGLGSDRCVRNVEQSRDTRRTKLEAGTAWSGGAGYGACYSADKDTR